MDINNHAYTTLLGSNCLATSGFEILVDVSGWNVSAGSVDCPTISGAISYYHPMSGKVYMLVCHQDIHCLRLTNHLMCFMQSWMAGFSINDIPKFIVDDPDEKTHAIIFDDPMNPNEPLITLLVLKGVTGYLLSRKPIASEYIDESIPHIYIIIEAPVWEPSQTVSLGQEGAIIDFRGEVINS